ncbi:hypothetical protein AO387_21320 [Pseudomonas syringae ICMP 11168]|nr:hypothetical protein AO387_21320 [Pseudomonas syringae ICMP 11168]
MWSHYAKHHTGFVAEFWQSDWLPKGASDSDNRFLVAFPVEYVKARPAVDKWTSTMEEEVEKIFMAKSLEWRYEEEERVIDFVNGPGAYEFEPSMLKSILAGVNISEQHFSLLKSAIKAFNKKWGVRVELYRAKVDSLHYRLLIPGFHRKRPTGL